MTPNDVARIGQALYAQAQHRGASAWKAWLADGLGVSSEAVKAWTSGRACIPEPAARLLRAAEPLAAELDMSNQPRGEPIAARLADLVRGGG